jgi:hypothetical protein
MLVAIAARPESFRKSRRGSVIEHHLDGSLRIVLPY